MKQYSGMSLKRKRQSVLCPTPLERFPYVSPQLQAQMQGFWRGLLGLIGPPDENVHPQEEWMDTLLNTYFFVLFVFQCVEATSTGPKRLFRFSQDELHGQTGYLSCCLDNTKDPIQWTQRISEAWELQTSLIFRLDKCIWVDRNRCDFAVQRTISDIHKKITDATFFMPRRGIFASSCPPQPPMYGPRTFLEPILKHERQCKRLQKVLLFPTVLFSIIGDYMDTWESLERLQLK